MSSVSQAKSIRARIRVANKSPSDSQVPNVGFPSRKRTLDRIGSHRQWPIEFRGIVKPAVFQTAASRRKWQPRERRVFAD